MMFRDAVVVLMFSVCRPCAQVACMATKEGGTAAAAAPATLEAEPRGVRHRTFSRDDPEHLPVHAT
jgi:hypothetical protein